VSKKLPYKFKTKPFKHQLDCFERSKEERNFALLMEMGTGKTKVLIDTVAYMFDSGWINALIVFANKGSYDNWLLELPIHMPTHIKYYTAIWRANALKKEREQLDGLFEEKNMVLKILIMNTEAMAYKRSAKFAQKFLLSNKCLMTIDESSMIRNHKAARTKTAVALGRYALARRIMTGSAVDNAPLNIYAQFDFLKEGLIGHTNYFSFRGQYAELETKYFNGKKPFTVVVGYKNLQGLKDKISQHAFIVKKEDCLDLPPKIYQKVFVELTDEQKIHYVDLVKKSVAELSEHETVTPQIALTKLLRLHQLICGHLTDDEGNVHNIPNNRLDVLDTIIEEMSGKAIIWANYRHDLHDITSFLREKYGHESTLTYFGETTDEERQKVKVMMKRGAKGNRKLRFIVGNTQTGGHGLTLTAANTVIYYSNNFNADYRNQSEDRAHRIGQTKKVTYIDIIAKDTVDEKILAVLRSKKQLSALLTPSNWKEFF